MDDINPAPGHKADGDWLTTKEVALLLRRSERRVLQMIQTKTLRAEKKGRDWMIKREWVARAILRPRGRPPRDG